jgi:hypothetical protein
LVRRASTWLTTRPMSESRRATCGEQRWGGAV